MLSAAATAYAFNHIVLPPKLPQQDDRETVYELGLLEIAVHALESLKLNVKHEHIGTITSAIETVNNLRGCRDDDGNTSQSQLQHILTKATNGVTIGAIPLEIKEQNAGILVSRSSDGLDFEFFELSPTNAAAMSPGRLLRTFPAYASRIPVGDVNPELLESIAGTLATMTTQPVPGFQPHITKNHVQMVEERDTTHPGLACDFLMNMISAFGEPTDVKRITKNTREEVLWCQCLAPWRRSPLWLLLRVSLQLVFARKAPDTLSSDGLYKSFMIFLLARIIDLAKHHWKEMDSEAIYIALSKLTQRLRKFSLLKQTGCLQPGWAQHIHDKMLDAHKLIKQHWQNRIDSSRANVNFNAIASLKPEADLDMYLLGLDVFLSSIKSRQQEVELSTFSPSDEYPSYHATELPTSLQLSDIDEGRYFRLAAIEDWVEHHLAGWASHHLHDENACSRLYGLITSYFGAASEAYARDPIGMSIMYLTVTELWVACDTIACNIYPLLFDYDPEVDLTEFQCLTLPLKSHLQRLHAVESYVQSRRPQRKEQRSSVFREFGHLSSFAVRYYDQCQSLQATLSKIEIDAAAKRQEKCEELVDLKRQHADYMNRYETTKCQYVTSVYDSNHGYTEQKHSKNCDRCTAKNRANGLTIELFEWPLSPKLPEAKATIFELMIPEAYSDWRETTAYLIATVLGYKDANLTRPSCFYTLDMHHDLSHLISSRYHERRIVPLSQVKSHTVTHRKMKKAIPHLTDNDVCLENALQYRMYDTVQGSFTKQPSCTEEVSENCVYHLPERSKALERFMHRPPTSPDGEQANEVIVS